MKLSILPRTSLIIAVFCMFSISVFSQDDLLPSLDDLFLPAPPLPESDEVEPFEFVDELSPIDMLPPIHGTQTPTASPSPAIENQEAAPQEFDLPPIGETQPVSVTEDTPVQQEIKQEEKTPTPVQYAAPAQQAGAIPVYVYSEHNGWMISVHGGSNLFYGDVTVYPLWPAKEYNNERKWAMGVSLDKEFNTYVQARGNLIYGTLSGTKREYSNGSPANIYFDATLFEYSAALKLTLNAENPFSVYCYGGLGFVHFRSQRKDLRTNAVLMSYGYDQNNNKTSPTIEAMAPLGIGFDYRFTDNLSVNLDISLRIVNTDKLDATISNPNPFFQDMYGYTAIGLSYRFGRRTVSAVPQMTYYEPPRIEEEIVEELAVEPEVELPEITFEPTEEIVDVLPAVIDELPLIQDIQPQPVIQEIVREPIPVAEPAAPAQSETVYEQVDAQTGLVFRVQIIAVQTARDNQIRVLQNVFNLNETIYEEVSPPWYRYTVGNFATLQEASAYRQVLIEKGLTDCFVVPYYNGKRISLQEARQIR